MNKAFSSEMILTIGILIASLILLLQLRYLISSQQKIAEKEIVYQFASNIENIIDKAIAITGSAALNYKPILKKYSVLDKPSGKNISFVVTSSSLSDNKIKNQDTICIMKTTSLTKIIAGECPEISNEISIIEQPNQNM